MKTKYIIIIILILMIIVGGYFVARKYLSPKKASTPQTQTVPQQSVTAATQTSPTNSATTSNPTTSQTPTSPREEPNGLIEPVIDFRARVTKKPFGIYITPQNSPIQPEKFTGYHTGADAEYGDVDSDTPVYAISDGDVMYSGTVSGYGGVLVINHQIGSQNILCLYGHVAVSSIPSKGTHITKGQTLGRLGHAYSTETDGERKHLHFAMLKGSSIDFRGYVQLQSELSAWYNPLDYFPE